MMDTQLGVNQEKLLESSEILRALAHPLRMRLLGFIDEHETVNVNRIYNTLKLEQSITSQHLRILRQQNLVNTRREGKFIHYSVNHDKVAQAVKAVDAFLKSEA
ncbi:MAG: helix-turn-helix transcriptional regulator [Bacteroidetes bacterium]|nr:helix-turn-helix transcriptional regulator [Bacteroidota bacterium]